MRSPRRTFASPFVVTVLGAATSAGFTSCNPPAAQRPPVMNPPGPEPGPVGTGSAEPTAGSDAPVISENGGYTTEAPAPQDGETRWTISKMGDHCMAALHIACPKPATPGGAVPTCNPPAPVKYACPDGVTLEHAIEIGRYANAKTCYVVPEAYTCPAGAICNPPPPRDADCPTR